MIGGGGLWTIATVASVAIHVVLLALMAAFSSGTPPPPPQTEISVVELPSDTVAPMLPPQETLFGKPGEQLAAVPGDAAATPATSGNEQAIRAAGAAGERPETVSPDVRLGPAAKPETVQRGSSTPKAARLATPEETLSAAADATPASPAASGAEAARRAATDENITPSGPDREIAPAAPQARTAETSNEASSVPAVADSQPAQRAQANAQPAERTAAEPATEVDDAAQIAAASSPGAAAPRSADAKQVAPAQDAAEPISSAASDAEPPTESADAKPAERADSSRSVAQATPQAVPATPSPASPARQANSAEPQPAQRLSSEAEPSVAVETAEPTQPAPPQTELARAADEARRAAPANDAAPVSQSSFLAEPASRVTEAARAPQPTQSPMAEPARPAARQVAAATNTAAPVSHTGADETLDDTSTPVAPGRPARDDTMTARQVLAPSLRIGRIDNAAPAQRAETASVMSETSDARTLAATGNASRQASADPATATRATVVGVESGEVAPSQEPSRVSAAEAGEVKQIAPVGDGGTGTDGGSTAGRAPLAATTVAPVSSGEGDAGAEGVPSSSGGEAATRTVQPIGSGGRSDDRLAILVPKEPASGGSSEAGGRRGVGDFLRDYDRGGCFVVLPSARPDGGVGLEGFARDKTELAAFLKDFEADTGVAAQPRSAAVSAAQCKALSFARNLPGYPDFTLYFDIDDRKVVSGSELAGTIHNVDGLPLHLFLVDDRGVVQSIDGFVEQSGDTASFSVPITLTSGPVETVQLVIALAGPDELDTIPDINGSNADTYFSALSEELASRDQPVDIGIASFTVTEP